MFQKISHRKCSEEWSSKEVPDDVNRLAEAGCMFLQQITHLLNWSMTVMGG